MQSPEHLDTAEELCEQPESCITLFLTPDKIKVLMNPRFNFSS